MSQYLTKHSANITVLYTVGTCLLVVFFSLFFCSASYAKNQSKHGFSPQERQSKLSHKLSLNEEDIITKSQLRQGHFIGYSHKFRQSFGLNLSLDTYLSTNQSDNSFNWIVGLVTDLFKVRYQTDQTAYHEHLELVSSYPLSDSLKLKGYASNKQDGKDEYKDYSVGIAFSVNDSLEISAGYADKELKKVETQSNIFLNINGVF